MNRHWTTITAALAVLCFSATGWSQQGGTAGGAATGGGQTAGFGSTGVPTTGFSLSSRFSSNFDRFMGGSQSAGQTTAGASAGTSGVFGQSTNAMGNVQQGNRASSFNRAFGMGMGMGFGNQRFGGQRMGNTANTNNTARMIRTRLRLGFTAPSPAAAPAGIRSAVSNVSKILVREKLAASPIAAELDGSVVVLRGTVESERGRELAQRLALLEPGIWEVRNELRVGPPEPTASPAPKPNAEDGTR